MLNNLLVKEFLEKEFNKHGEELQEEFKIYNGAGHVESRDADKTNGILNQLGNNDISKIMNYTNIVSNYELEMVVCVIGGFVRLNDVITVINKTIEDISCKPLELFGGTAIFTFKMPYLGDLSSRGVIGNSVLLKLYFELQFSSTNGGKKFEMALLDFPFDEQSQNTRWFRNRQEQVKWFDERIQDTGVPFSYLMQPVQSSQLITQKKYLNDLRYYPEGTEKVVDANEVLQKNYAVVREVENDEVKDYWFYYVQSSQIGADNQIVVDLKMDTIQTYFFNPNIEIPDCMIERAHLNRWEQGEYDSDIKFKGGVKSDLFEREEVQNVAKRLVSRKQISLNTFFAEDEINNWLDNNVQYWIYLFLDPKSPYKLINGINGENQKLTASCMLEGFGKGTRVIPYQLQDIESGSYNYIDTGFVAVCFPIYKTSKRIKIKANGKEIYITLDIEGLINFEILNKDYAYVYSKKISALPPFGRDVSLSTKYSYKIDANGDLVLSCNVSDTSYPFEGAKNEDGSIKFDGMINGGKIRAINGYALSTLSHSNTDFSGLYAVTFQSSSVLTKEIDLGVKFEYSKSHVTTNWLRESEFNPKLLSSDYREILISDQTGNGFSYDLQKLNTNKIRILYTEPLTPDVTKTYIRIYNTNGIYIPETSQNYTGYVGSNDMSLTMATSQYQQMLANNKNYFMQSTLNIATSAGSSILGGASEGIKSSFGKGILTGLISTGVSLLNQSLSIDNMKNAPSNIQKATGSAILNTMVSNIGVWVEDYDILPYEKEIINDYIHMFGFSVNKIGYINDYLNTRKYFNYIKAKIEDILVKNKQSLSSSAKRDFILRFSNGIRFWNNKDFENRLISYDYENYETWLER